MGKIQGSYIPRTTDAQWSLISLKSTTFALGQTNWADKFWGIWGIFGPNFGTLRSLSIFSIIELLFLKNQAFELELVSKELNHLAAILHVYTGGLNFMK